MQENITRLKIERNKRETKRPAFLPPLKIESIDFSLVASPFGNHESFCLDESIKEAGAQISDADLLQVRYKNEYQTVGLIDTWSSIFEIISSNCEITFEEIKEAIEYFVQNYAFDEKQRLNLESFLSKFTKTVAEIETIRHEIINPVKLEWTEPTDESPFASFSTKQSDITAEEYSSQKHKLFFLRALISQRIAEDDVNLDAIEIEFKPGIIAQVVVKGIDNMRLILQAMREDGKAISQDDWYGFTSGFKGKPYIVVCDLDELPIDGKHNPESYKADEIAKHEYRHVFDRFVEDSDMGATAEFNSLIASVNNGDIDQEKMKSELERLFLHESRIKEKLLFLIKRELLAFLLGPDDFSQIQQTLFAEKGYGLAQVIRERIQSTLEENGFDISVLQPVDELISQVNLSGDEALIAAKQLNEFGLSREQIAALFTDPDKTIDMWPKVVTRFIEDWEGLIKPK